jgi:hypothetical protein
MFRKMEDRDSNKLRKLEREFKTLRHEFEMLKLDYGMLRSDYRSLEKRVDAKEITHVQKVKVELTKPFDYDGWLP